MSARELARLERRRAVARAAREVQRVRCVFRGGVHIGWDESERLAAALALPRHWTTGFQRWQPKRTTRRKRTARWVVRAVLAEIDARESALAREEGL